MKILQTIQNSRTTKYVAAFLAILMLDPITGFNALFANAGGPTQPEFSKYTAVSASDLVDPFTGNVGYSVPLFDIGGYPVTMSYSGDINPEQDAGWVGLGWGLNLGSINRAMRGVPDDFNGDPIKTTEKKKNNVRLNVNLKKVKSELVVLSHTHDDNSGTDYDHVVRKVRKMNLGIEWDSYTGLGYTYGRDAGEGNDIFDIAYKDSLSENVTELENPDIEVPVENVLKFVSANVKRTILDQCKEEGTKMPINISYNTKRGFNFSGNIVQNAKLQGILKGVGIVPTGASYNSRSGRASLGMDIGFSNNGLNASYTPNLLFVPTFHSPPSDFVSRDFQVAVDFSTPSTLQNSRRFSVLVDVSINKLKHNKEEFSRESYGTLYMGNGNDYPNEKGKNNVITDVQEHGTQIDRYSKEMSTVSVNYDVFNISAAGIGGSFRLNQNRLLLYGPGTFSQTPSVTGLSLKGEFGSSGATSELGVDVGVNLVRRKYESLASNDFKNASIPTWMNFTESSIGNTWQSQTMRNDFEFIENQREYSDNFLGTDAIYFNPGPRLKLAKRFKGEFKTNTGTTKELTGAIQKNARDARQQVVTYMTAEEASTKSFQPYIENYMSINGQPLVVSNGSVFSPAKSNINRFGSSNNDGQEYRKKHHISEITVLQPDGSRYYFGTPVYNTSQDEYTFNVAQELYPLQGGSSNSPNIYKFNNGTTDFNSADIGINNKKGTDEYSNHRNISAYASTYLLNSVLSADYVDKTNNGPTEDDLGNYVKFNYWQSTYKKLNPEGTDWEYSPFKWRSSYQNADLNLNNRSDQFDDKGNFTFGKKELWYIHSIETKDQIALFYLGKRQDGIEAYGIFGGINNDVNANYQYYLEKVVLYSKAEFNKLGTAAIPLKTVHLEYAYDLCKGFPYTKAGNLLNKKHPLTGNTNDYNQGGKLTLYKVWFTYGSLEMPTTAPFVFNYSGFNPSYSYKSVDRWGTYADSAVVNYGIGNNIKNRTNIDYPYTKQNDQTNANNWSSAWMLSDIILPSGGKIHIDYESDDYAYVQNRQAMEMVKIEAFSDRADIVPLYGVANELYTEADKFNFNMAALNEQKVKDLFKPSRQYAIVKLNSGKSITDYCSVGDMLYYNACISLDKNDFKQADYEPINGYAEVSEIGNLPNNYGYIKFKHENAGPWPVNMMFRMAMQQGLNKAPHLFYPNSDLRRNPENITDFVGLALGTVKEAIQMITTKIKYFQNANMCRYVDLNRSFLRLNSVSKKKYGGGHRVKQVSISDQWNVLTGGDEKEASYKIKYEYNTTENGVEISSGVASYEPFPGGDENPFRMPKDIKPVGIDKLMGKSTSKVGKEFQGLGPQQLSFDLDPVGEEFYPSAVVGYSRVKISTVYPTIQNSTQIIDKHKTGYTVSEFYTAKEFPSYSERTTLERRQTNIKGPSLKNLIGAVKFTNIEKMKMRNYTDIPEQYRTQEQKDFLSSMKDKQEEKEKGNTKWGLDVSVQLQYTLASQGFKIVTNDMHGKIKSNLVYTEDMTTPFSGSYYHYKVDEYGNLINNIDVVRKNGQIDNVVAGLQIEPVVFGSQITETNHNIRPKVDVEIKTPLLVIPMASIGYGLNRKTSKFITITKHIRQSGLIDYVQVFDKGATTTTKNLAWDALTGQVLITSINNEHNDVVYNVTKPAHWIYEGLNGAFKNVDLKIDLQTTGGVAAVSNNLLVPGDELIHRFDEANYPLNADANKYWVLSVVGNNVHIINNSGQLIADGNYKFKVVRSGRRNILGMGAETITLTKEPWEVNNNIKSLKIDPKSVIVGKGLTYSDDRQVFEKLKNCWSFQCEEVEQTFRPPSNDLVFPYNPKTPTFSSMNCPGEPNGFGQIFNSVAYITKGSDGYFLGDIVNPYTSGIMGVWKPLGDYTYYDKRNGKEVRTQTQASGAYDPNYTNIRKDGLLEDYQEFWDWNGLEWKAKTAQDTANPWNLSETLQHVDDRGNAWQSKNVLDIHSSAIYGYGDRKLVTANSVNAKTNEILFDGFEEFDTEDNVNVYCNGGEINTFEWSSFTAYVNRFSKNVYHWPISKLLIGNANQVVLTESHTGWKSLRLGPGTNTLPFASSQSSAGGLMPNQYRLTSSDFISKFNLKYKPTGENEYILSYWVKENIPNQFQLKIYQVGSATPQALTPTETAIYVDGWKKVSYKFEISNDLDRMEIINDIGLVIPGTVSLNQCCYLDDLRIHPYKSSFASYVYDYRNYRLMATLDDNNFASFLEYDEEGALVRKKVETERGIMTVQENRNSSKR